MVAPLITLAVVSILTAAVAVPLIMATYGIRIGNWCIYSPSTNLLGFYYKGLLIVYLDPTGRFHRIVDAQYKAQISSVNPLPDFIQVDTYTDLPPQIPQFEKAWAQYSSEYYQMGDWTIDVADPYNKGEKGLLRFLYKGVFVFGMDAYTPFSFAVDVSKYPQAQGAYAPAIAATCTDYGGQYPCFNANIYPSPPILSSMGFGNGWFLQLDSSSDLVFINAGIREFWIRNDISVMFKGLNTSPVAHPFILNCCPVSSTTCQTCPLY